MVLNDTMANLKYNYLNKKIIEVRLKDSIDLDGVSDVTVIKNNAKNLKLEIDTGIINTARIIEILGLENINDINISNIPLENIITNIYRS